MESLFRSKSTRKMKMFKNWKHKRTFATKPAVDDNLRAVQETSQLRFGATSFFNEANVYNSAPNMRSRAAPTESDELLQHLEVSNPRYGNMSEGHIFDQGSNASFIKPQRTWDSLETEDANRFDQSAAVLENHTYGSTGYFSMQGQVRPKQCLDAGEEAGRWDQFAFEHEKHVYGSTKYFSMQKWTVQMPNTVDESTPRWKNTELYETRSQKTTCKV